MTTINGPILVGTKDHNTKREAWELRQDSTGWGHAFAHLIPFYGLRYAVTRRTITPFIYSFFGQLAVTFLLLAGTPEMTEAKRDNYATVLWLVTSPCFVKMGIDSARNHAALKLQEDS